MTKPCDAASPLPVQDGFFMPAEWEPHRRTWMCWPASVEPFGDGERLFAAKQAVALVARAIAAFEPVALVAKAADMAEARLSTGGKVQLIEAALDDSWARDIGPTFLSNGAGMLSGIQWQFNGWGGKYAPYTNDKNFASRVLTLAGAKFYEATLVAEGGALHSDGRGTVMTTEQCLLNPNRNPDLSKEEIEETLRLYLGARTVLWLGSGFSDHETDGHIDNIACFAAPGRVIIGMPASRSDPDFLPAREALRRLKAARDAEGRNLEIVELPQPKHPRASWRGGKLPASYVNFYLPNGAVIIPAFDDPNDEAARSVLADCFPQRDMVQIDALDIVEGGGGIHCITQQEPQV